MSYIVGIFYFCREEKWFMKKVMSLLLGVIILLCGNVVNVHAETNQENLPDYEVVLVQYLPLIMDGK